MAVADAFEDRLDTCLKSLAAASLKDRIDVPKQRQFVGLDAYQQALACGVDLVLLSPRPASGPPSSRPP